MKNMKLIILLLALMISATSVNSQVKSDDKKGKQERQSIKKGRKEIKKEAEAEEIKGNKPVSVTREITGNKPVDVSATREIINIDSSFEEFLGRTENFRENKENGVVDWTEQYIEAKGESVIDTVRFKNHAQARAMATRGAVVIAQRNLLETINGVKIVGETTVENMITTSDYIFSRVEGVVKGAEMVGQPREKYGMIEVTLKVPIYKTNGLAPAVINPNFKSLGRDNELGGSGRDNELEGSGRDNEENEISNFAFNLNGKKYDPSMFPLVVDENDNILIDFSKYYDPSKGKFPKILQSTKDIMKEIGLNKEVEFIDVISAANGKLVVNTKIKKKFNWDKVADVTMKVGKILLLLI